MHLLREPKSASVTERTTFGARATPGPRVFTFGCFEVGTPLSEGVPYAVCRSWPQRAIPADCQRRPRAAWLVGGHRSRKSGARLSSGGWVRWYGLPRRQPWPVVGSGRFLGLGLRPGPRPAETPKPRQTGVSRSGHPGGHFGCTVSADALGLLRAPQPLWEPVSGRSDARTGIRMSRRSRVGSEREQVQSQAACPQSARIGCGWPRDPLQIPRGGGWGPGIPPASPPGDGNPRRPLSPAPKCVD